MRGIFCYDRVPAFRSQTCLNLVKKPAVTTSNPRRIVITSPACARCGPATEMDQPPRSSASSVQSSTSSGAVCATYRVEGTACGPCAGRVTEAVSRLEGVQDAQVQLVSANASAVTVASAIPVPARVVRAAVEQAGYTLVHS